MFRIVTALFVLASLIASPFLASAQQAATEKKDPVRVGTYDARAVAVGYYRSFLHDQWLKDGNVRYKAAKDAGQKDLAEKIKKEFEADQDMAHRQTFGTGPYDSLKEQLKPVLAEVARSQNVDLIVPLVTHASPRVEAVDVTEALLTQLKADEKTRKIIAEMNEKIASGKYDPMQYKGAH